MSLLFTIILVLINIPIYYLIQFTRRKRRMTKYVEHLQSPNEYPIIGSGLFFAFKNTEQIMDSAVEFMAQTPTPFYAWLGGVLVMFLDHPDDVHAVLSSKSCLEKPYVAKFMNFDTSLASAPVNVWRPQRKNINKAFSLKILESFTPIFNDKVKCLIRNLGEKVDKGHFDVSPIIYNCTLEMACQTTLGVNIDAQNGKNEKYVEALLKYLEVVTKRIANIFYHFEFIYKWSALYKLDCKYRREIDRLTQEVVDAIKATHFPEDEREIDENDEDQHYKTPQTFIHQLFRWYNEGLVNDQNIHDHVFLMIIAGSDTSALTLSCAILFLAIHPEVQERAAAEADRVFADLAFDEELAYKHTTRLEYIDQVLKETLRLNPVFPYLPRLCTEDTKIREDLTIPADSAILVNLFTMHRRTDIWGGNADSFDPDRFSADQVKKRHPHAFAPFSLGARNCIGMHYANIEMKIILANLLRHYQFKTHLKMSDVRTRIEVTLKSAQGNIVQVERRQHNK